MAHVVKFPSPDTKASLNDLISDLIAMESKARELEQLDPDLSSLRATISEVLNVALKNLRDLKTDDDAE